MSEENKNIYIQYWLLLITLLVGLMIIVGGLTRLTDSGLSITRWDLISGILPPFSLDDWEETFSLYKQIPEFKLLNFSMTLNEFKTIYTSSGDISDDSESAEDIIGSITMEYNDWDKRRPSKLILKEILEKSADIYGIKVESREQEEGPPGGKPINIELTSLDYEILNRETKRLTSYLDKSPGVINVENTIPMPGIQWELEIDRAQASKFQADISSIGNVIKLITNGIKLGEYRPEESTESVPIYLRYSNNNRTLDMLENIRIPTNVGLVPISNIVKTERIFCVLRVH